MMLMKQETPMPQIRSTPLFLSGALVLLLAACGGGGGDAEGFDQAVIFALLVQRILARLGGTRHDHRFHARDIVRRRASRHLDRRCPHRGQDRRAPSRAHP